MVKLRLPPPSEIAPEIVPVPEFAPMTVLEFSVTVPEIVAPDSTRIAPNPSHPPPLETVKLLDMVVEK